MSEGFLGRWSRRKQDVREGRPSPEPAAAPAVAPLQDARVPAAAAVAPVAEPSAAAEVVPAPAPPTLDDARKLTPQSDFKPFMAGDVAPEVKNAAMKQLFADPHFNVMDGLDVYIDDYSIPDPLPASMLRKMASAQFLKLFDEDKAVEGGPAAVPAPDPIAAQAAGAESAPAAVPDLPNPQDNHADPDLRLQQDHAAGAQGSGSGA